jgi:predicted metalloendopeptidase
LTGLFGFGVFPDFVDTSVNALFLGGPYYGMPSLEYYGDDPAFAEIQEAYIAANAELLQLAGYDETRATEAAEAVFELERALSAPTLTPAEQQDFSLFYNPKSLAELAEIYPLMDWEAFVAANGLVGVDQIVVVELRYLEALNDIVEGASIDALKDFLKLEALWSFAGFLSDEIGATAFQFSAVLFGFEERTPLNERVLIRLQEMMGEAVGKLYVDEYFPPEAKAQIEELVAAEVAAFRARLEANSWMTAETKATAIEKLDAMLVKVGYPDTWRSYDEVTIEDSYAMSALSAFNAEYRRSLARFGQPVDRDEWGMLPQEINAGYDPLINDMTFPAAILQPPFFDYQADPASNFGAIGFVIGHEITHGFDANGSNFDSQGNLVNWWTEEDAARFDELNQLVVDQFGAIEVLPGLNVDGELTLTENVADLGGVQIAFDALQSYLQENGDPGEIDGFSQEQRFFIAAATVWREKIRPETLETLVRTDEHAPSEIRATLPIRNMDQFYEAFDIGAGDPMYLPPDERIVIW